MEMNITYVEHSNSNNAICSIKNKNNNNYEAENIENLIGVKNGQPVNIQLNIEKGSTIGANEIELKHDSLVENNVDSSDLNDSSTSYDANVISCYDKKSEFDLNNIKLQNVSPKQEDEKLNDIFDDYGQEEIIDGFAILSFKHLKDLNREFENRKRKHNLNDNREKAKSLPNTYLFANSFSNDNSSVKSYSSSSSSSSIITNHSNRNNRKLLKLSSAAIVENFANITFNIVDSSLNKNATKNDLMDSKNNKDESKITEKENLNQDFIDVNQNQLEKKHRTNNSISTSNSTSNENCEIEIAPSSKESLTDKQKQKQLLQQRILSPSKSYNVTSLMSSQISETLNDNQITIKSSTSPLPPIPPPTPPPTKSTDSSTKTFSLGYNNLNNKQIFQNNSLAAFLQTQYRPFNSNEPPVFKTATTKPTTTEEILYQNEPIFRKLLDFYQKSNQTDEDQIELTKQHKQYQDQNSVAKSTKQISSSVLLSKNSTPTMHSDTLQSNELLSVNSQNFNILSTIYPFAAINQKNNLSEQYQQGLISTKTSNNNQLLMNKEQQQLINRKLNKHSNVSYTNNLISSNQVTIKNSHHHHNNDHNHNHRQHNPSHRSNNSSQIGFSLKNNNNFNELLRSEGSIDNNTHDKNSAKNDANKFLVKSNANAHNKPYKQAQFQHVQKACKSIDMDDNKCAQLAGTEKNFKNVSNQSETIALHHRMSLNNTRLQSQQENMNLEYLKNQINYNNFYSSQTNDLCTKNTNHLTEKCFNSSKNNNSSSKEANQSIISNSLVVCNNDAIIHSTGSSHNKNMDTNTRVPFFDNVATHLNNRFDNFTQYNTDFIKRELNSRFLQTTKPSHSNDSKSINKPLNETTLKTSGLLPISPSPSNLIANSVSYSAKITPTQTSASSTTTNTFINPLLQPHLKTDLIIKPYEANCITSQSLQSLSMLTSSPPSTASPSLLKAFNNSSSTSLVNLSKSFSTHVSPSKGFRNDKNILDIPQTTTPYSSIQHASIFNGTHQFHLNSSSMIQRKNVKWCTAHVQIAFMIYNDQKRNIKAQNTINNIVKTNTDSKQNDNHVNSADQPLFTSNTLNSRVSEKVVDINNSNPTISSSIPVTRALFNPFFNGNLNQSIYPIINPFLTINPSNESFIKPSSINLNPLSDIGSISSHHVSLQNTTNTSAMNNNSNKNDSIIIPKVSNMHLTPMVSMDCLDSKSKDGSLKRNDSANQKLNNFNIRNNHHEHQSHNSNRTIISAEKTDGLKRGYDISRDLQRSIEEKNNSQHDRIQIKYTDKKSRSRSPLTRANPTVLNTNNRHKDDTLYQLGFHAPYSRYINSISNLNNKEINEKYHHDLLALTTMQSAKNTSNALMNQNVENNANNLVASTNKLSSVHCSHSNIQPSPRYRESNDKLQANLKNIDTVSISNLTFLHPQSTSLPNIFTNTGGIKNNNIVQTSLNDGSYRYVSMGNNSSHLDLERDSSVPNLHFQNSNFFDANSTQSCQLNHILLPQQSTPFHHIDVSPIGASCSSINSVNSHLTTKQDLSKSNINVAIPSLNLENTEFNIRSASSPHSGTVLKKISSVSKLQQLSTGSDNNVIVIKDESEEDVFIKSQNQNLLLNQRVSTKK